CDTPIFSGLSWSDAARTQVPKATDRTPGMYSESTVNPFARTVRRSSDSAACAARITRANVLHFYRRENRRHGRAVFRHDPTRHDRVSRFHLPRLPSELRLRPALPPLSRRPPPLPP